MRIAVFSDVHANLHALEAVLQAVEREDVDELWCLGDLVGYGPRPNSCCEAVSHGAATCLAGNHDLGVLGSVPLDDFAPEAATSARWTRDVLAGEARAYLEQLAPAGRTAEVELYHASPRDPVWEYLLDEFSIRRAFADTSAPLVLVGHSHIALAAVLDSDRLSFGHAPAGTDLDLAAGRILLNPGSVGQPRDGDPRAAFLLLDLEHQTATFHRVGYSIERTQAEIRKEKLPEVLAERLAHGI
jgi:diadenosine tetraphosphatase ApaH/serine/threonine PP2A family protein phosphatase